MAGTDSMLVDGFGRAVVNAADSRARDGAPETILYEKGQVPVLKAVEDFRRMRGKTDSRLMQAENGRNYVVKFTGNPNEDFFRQNGRILANELFSSQMLQHLGIDTPGWSLIDVSQQMIEKNKDIGVITDQKKQIIVPFKPGIYFGSLVPITDLENPDVLNCFDTLPEDESLNLKMLQAVLPFDKWVGNSDKRQVLFHRDVFNVNKPWVLSMIDNGDIFDGRCWKFWDRPDYGLFYDTQVYEGVTGYESFDPSLERIKAVTPELIDKMAGNIPEVWYDGNSNALSRLCAELFARRNKVPDLIGEMQKADINLFPNWRVRVAGSKMPKAPPINQEVPAVEL